MTRRTSAIAARRAVRARCCFVLAGSALAALAVAPTAWAGGDELQPAEEARAAERASAAEDFKVGKFADLEGVKIKVTKIEIHEPTPDRPERTIHASARFENRSDERLELPDIGVFCKGTEDSTDGFADTTVRPGDDLPKKSFADGLLVFALPDNCKKAALRFTQTGFFRDDFPPMVEVPFKPAKLDVVPSPPEAITAAEFDQIQPGMTLDQVVAVIGGAGEEISVIGEFATYEWKAIPADPDSFIAYATIHFTNGVVDRKTGSGLS